MVPDGIARPTGFVPPRWQDVPYREPPPARRGAYPTVLDSDVLNLSPLSHPISMSPNPPIPPSRPVAPEPNLSTELLAILSTGSTDPLSSENLGGTDATTTVWHGQTDGVNELPWGFPPLSEEDEEIASSDLIPSHGSDKSLSSLTKRRRSSDGWTQADNSSLSWTSPNQAIAGKSTNQFILTGLLRIYHDVLENNLTCWLTEATCPYKSEGLTVYAANRQGMKQERGVKWSNRMYNRTLKLDRVAIANGMIHVSASESLAASRALSLAIVAFAAQWAQGSQRQRETQPTSPRPSFATSSTDSQGSQSAGRALREEFDRKIQRQLWEQARAALQQLSDVECFRVACAEIIFALTQRPFDMEATPLELDELDMFAGPIGLERLKSRLLTRLSVLISTEGPPIYMERAARKIQALKSRVDSCRRSTSTYLGVCRPGNTSGTQKFLSNEDQATVDLLYWLAVMFDTVSSCMNDRPVVVSDDESAQAPLPENSDTVSCQVLSKGASFGRWNVQVFIRDNVHAPQEIPVWPCSQEEVADAIIKSAPIKVLHFRHVSYLQSIIRKGVRGKPVDDLIERAICVYRYWEMTYGPFFRSLINDINLISFRTQGWFICIAAHWYLASLMLTDLIDFVDSNGLSTPAATHSRILMSTTAMIREHTIKDLSDLARISTPRTDGSDDGAVPAAEVEFHHAITECVILTEPWTMILIKVFTKASVILISAVEEAIDNNSDRPGWACEKLLANLAMAEECIKALWNLGKKSDLSRKSAEVLSVALDKLHVHLGAVC